MEAAIFFLARAKRGVSPVKRERGEERESDATADTGKLLANPCDKVEASLRAKMFAFIRYMSSVSVLQQWVSLSF